MENRRKLHESGVVLIIIGILNLFMFMATVVDSILDGTVAEGLANVDADILGAVKVSIVIVCALMALLVGADILLGIKAIQETHRKQRLHHCRIYLQHHGLDCDYFQRNFCFQRQRRYPGCFY